MCGDWWISILGLCQFLSVCGLSILVIILIKGNEKRNRKRWEKGSKYDWTTDKNKEQVDFVHKTKSTFNYWIEVQFDYWIIHLMNGLLNQQTESFFHLFIRLATAMLDMLWLTFHKKNALLVCFYTFNAFENVKSHCEVHTEIQWRYLYGKFSTFYFALKIFLRY